MVRNWKLVVAAGPAKGLEFEIDQSQGFVIGRGSDSHTKIRDPKVSRSHCEIRFDGEAPTLVDVGGAGGTTVDGKRVEQAIPLRNGSMIGLGDTLLRFVDTSSGSDSPTVRISSADVHQELRAQYSSMHELIGQTLHVYRVDSLVVSGRNSMIFKGTDTKRDEVVAIKVLLPQMTATDEQKERFIRAMKTVLPLSHPHIVKLHAAGKKGPYCWAALDWIEGTSVAKLIERIGIAGVLPWREAFRCGLHIARALVAASDNQIMHRNITPANILRRDRDSMYFLSDLVFAKALELTDAAQLTRPGDIIGDLGYLAPERVMESDKADVRSDFFGLGATMYALLTGQPPFAAKTIADWFRTVEGPPPASPAVSQMGIDERFCDLTMRLINKDPAKRFETAKDVLEDFKRVGRLAGLDVTA